MAHGLILIIGAGPTGLVLALWLARLGVRVRIIDKAPELGTTSRALAVQVRTLEFYRQGNLADTFIAGGVKIGGVNFWAQGSKVARVPFQRIGEGLSPYPFVLVFPQDAHERMLIEQLDLLRVKVERLTELIRFDQNSECVRAVLKRPDGSEEICEAAGPATDRELHVDLEEADSVLVFPLKTEGRARLVGTVREPSDNEQSVPTFGDVRGRAIQHLKLDILTVNWFSTYRVHHRVASHFRQGRTFLLGDAAHIHSPIGGQGMNTGIGDAVNLAWKLAMVLKEEAADNLLDTYEAERIVCAAARLHHRLFTIVTKRGLVARWVRTKLVPFIAPLLFRVAAVRRFFFRTASQIGGGDRLL
jgi:2-polyprenyl-6-methoxyphenol hydroxylase-like FAD-dependent oxidoreductase